jgi:hypothetical protein
MHLAAGGEPVAVKYREVEPVNIVKIPPHIRVQKKE